MEFPLMAKYLQWSARQDYIVSNIDFMSKIYDSIHSKILSMGSINTITITKLPEIADLQSMIEKDSPFIWIPSTLPMNASDTTTHTFGTFYPLSELVIRYPGKDDRYRFDNCPVKIIKYYYCENLENLNHMNNSTYPFTSVSNNHNNVAIPSTDSMDISHLLARKDICKVCQAVEGMFGARGSSIKPIHDEDGDGDEGMGQMGRKGERRQV